MTPVYHIHPVWKMGLLVTISDSQITTKQKASYDFKIDITIMTSQFNT